MPLAEEKPELAPHLEEVMGLLAFPDISTYGTDAFFIVDSCRKNIKKINKLNN
eukprot:m.43956 g.43956  ORF g.43956 m.43956 type:complete len:53 (-) comp7139_c0_seq3:541-699(-)